MQPPMIGSWSVEVKGVHPFTIHGDLYYELHVVRLDDPTHTLLALRVPQHACVSQPVPGERLNITFLMSQVTKAERNPQSP